jgi:hypothetical protein
VVRDVFVPALWWEEKDLYPADLRHVLNLKGVAKHARPCDFATPHYRARHGGYPDLTLGLFCSLPSLSRRTDNMFSVPRTLVARSARPARTLPVLSSTRFGCHTWLVRGISLTLFLHRAFSTTYARRTELHSLDTFSDEEQMLRESGT